MLKNIFIQFVRDDSGAFVIILAAMMALFVGILALVLDMGHLHGVKMELQHAGDACALRGARAYYADVNPADPPNALNAVAQAWDTIGKNYSDFKALKDITDVVVGIWDYQKQGWDKTVAPESFSTVWPPPISDWGKYIGPGISLTTKKESGLNEGEVNMTLGKIPPVQIDSMPVGTLATAALSGVGSVGEGFVDLPIYIEKTWFLNAQSADTVIIKAFPDTTESGGWFSIPGDTNGDATNPGVLEQYIKGELEFPPMDVDPNTPTTSDILTQRGVIANMFDKYEQCTPPKNHVGSLYWKWYSSQPGAEIGTDEYGNPIYSPGPCGSTQPWMINLPVIADVGSANDTKPIIGFSQWEVVRVVDQPDKYIEVKPRGGVLPEAGGGAYFGLLSLEPKLVR